MYERNATRGLVAPIIGQSADAALLMVTDGRAAAAQGSPSSENRAYSLAQRSIAVLTPVIANRGVARSAYTCRILIRDEVHRCGHDRAEQLREYPGTSERYEQRRARVGPVLQQVGQQPDPARRPRSVRRRPGSRSRSVGYSRTAVPAVPVTVEVAGHERLRAQADRDDGGDSGGEAQPQRGGVLDLDVAGAVALDRDLLDRRVGHRQGLHDRVRERVGQRAVDRRPAIDAAPTHPVGPPEVGLLTEPGAAYADAGDRAEEPVVDGAAQPGQRAPIREPGTRPASPDRFRPAPG